MLPDGDRRSLLSEHAIAHDRFCVLVCIEAVVCFLAVGLILAMGTIYMPLFLWAALVEGEIYSREAAATVALGWARAGAVIRVLYLLWVEAGEDSWRSATLTGLSLGSAAVLYRGFNMWQGWSPGGPVPLTLITGLPLLCTLHLCYLARRPLFHRGRARTIA